MNVWGGNKVGFLITERLDQFQLAVSSTETTDIENRKFTLETGIDKTNRLLVNIRDANKDLYIVGNGGSAAIASHAAVDFINVGKISAHTLHDAATLTCMANDYGYENVFSNIVKCSLKSNDLLMAISSSGSSENIIAAVEQAKKNGSVVITFSGFSPDNQLRTIGHVNFWSDSRDYGVVEIAHQFILHNIADRLAVLPDANQ